MPGAAHDAFVWADGHRLSIDLDGRRDHADDAAGESARLAVPRAPAGMDIVLQLDTERHVGVANWVGTAVPLHASSAGKVVLAELGADELEASLGTAPLPAFTERTITDVRVLSAELARIRRQGWAEIDGELEEGLAAISVPVRSARGELAAIVGISGPHVQADDEPTTAVARDRNGHGNGDRTRPTPTPLTERARRSARGRVEPSRPRR